LTVKYHVEVGIFGMLMVFGGGPSFQVGCKGELVRLIPKKEENLILFQRRS